MVKFSKPVSFSMMRMKMVAHLTMMLVSSAELVRDGETFLREDAADATDSTDSLLGVATTAADEAKKARNSAYHTKGAQRTDTMDAMGAVDTLDMNANKTGRRVDLIAGDKQNSEVGKKCCGHSDCLKGKRSTGNLCTGACCGCLFGRRMGNCV